MSFNLGFADYQFTHSFCKVLSLHNFKVDEIEISNIIFPFPIKGYIWNDTDAPVLVLNIPCIQKLITPIVAQF